VLASGGGCQERNDKGFKLWDVDSGKELPGPEGQTGTVPAVAFSPDGKTVAYLDATNRHLRFWDVEGKKVRSSIEAPGFETLAYSLDGTALALGGGGGRVKVWEVATGKELHEFKADSTRVHHLRYTADGKGILLVNFNGNSIQLWEPEDKRDKLVVKTTGGTDRTVQFALAPKGKVVATLTIKGVLQLRDPKTWEVLAAVQADDKYAHALTFSPDGGTVVTGGNDGVVKLWDVAKLLAKKPEK
jgi:WD40 repeat protein